MIKNLGMKGIGFLEYALNADEEPTLAPLFESLGMVKIAENLQSGCHLYRQNRIDFILNNSSKGFAAQFAKSHGPSVCGMALRFDDPKSAYKEALRRGARPYEGGTAAFSVPTIYGIGDSLVYFLENQDVFDTWEGESKTRPSGLGTTVIDHLTNNVGVGELQKWCDFYENIFDFTEERFFDIKGESTGLISKVMKSPCGTFAIPINEPTDQKSQIQEYLDEYKGAGIQHIALLTNNIIEVVSRMRENGIEFLQAPPHTYYEALTERLPSLKENTSVLEELGILADGDKNGYLLQIFTKNQIGPIFFEVIQREGHDGFGEGNFQALFDAIEEDQRRRGVL